jgi:asparagine synthase (glutamine-hydrolysing)
MTIGQNGGRATLSVEQLCSEIRLILRQAVEKNLGEAILLSGGLDTSVLASIASRDASLKAFTVAFREADAPDLMYAELVAKYLGLRHNIHKFNREELFDALTDCIKVMRTFDPVEIRNDVAICIALRFARENNVKSVMTGDGCDELFAGYSFFLDYDEDRLKLELEKMQSEMKFASVILAEHLGMSAKLPFLNSEVKSFAAKLDPQYLVRFERERKWGKWLVRKAFEGILPEEIVWREKTPIEYGTGTTVLPSIFNREITQEEFELDEVRLLKDDRVAIQSKEQLFYYRIYRSVIGVPYMESIEGRRCPRCNSNISQEASYCRTCGAYPI